MDIREACFRGLPEAEIMLTVHARRKAAERAGVLPLYDEALKLGMSITEEFTAGFDQNGKYVRGVLSVGGEPRDISVPSYQDAVTLLQVSEELLTRLNVMHIEDGSVMGDGKHTKALARALADEWAKEVLDQAMR